MRLQPAPGLQTGGFLFLETWMYSELPNHNKIELEAFVDVVLGAGYSLSVSDGDDGWTAPSTEREKLVDWLGEMDSDEVKVYKGFDYVGWFWLVYGNEPGVLIADHTDTTECNELWYVWSKAVDAV